MKSLSASAATDPHYCCIYFATYEITECQCSHRSSLLLYILCYLWNHWVPVQPQILIIAVYTVLPLKSLSASAATDPHYCCIYFATYEITECQCSHRSSLLLYILCYLWNHWVPVQPQILIIAVYTVLLMKSLSASAATDPHYCCIYCATFEITECQCRHRSSLLLYIYFATYEMTECQCSHRSSLLLYILCYLRNHWVPVQPQILISAVYSVLLMKSLSASAATDPHCCCIYFATYEITECQYSHRSSLVLYILCYLWNHWVPVQPQILIIAVYTLLLMKSLSASTATDPH